MLRNCKASKRKRTENGCYLFKGKTIKSIQNDEDIYTKPIEFIKNKFPNESLPKNGKVINYTLKDGRITDIQGLRRMDFIIDKNGKLIIGKKHHTLGNADDVLAAGQLKVDGNGVIRILDNNSGHYRPNLEEASKYPGLFEKAGLNLDKAWINLNKYIVNDSGIIVKYENVVHRKIK